MMIPNTPFSTRLSGNAKETELRLRSIFQWKKKRPPMIVLVLAAVLLLGICGGLVGFRSTPSNGTFAEIYPEYFAEGAIVEIIYVDKADEGPSEPIPGSDEYAASMEYLRDVKLRAAWGHRRYIGDYDYRNGSFWLVNENDIPLKIELYPDDYIVVSTGWGQTEDHSEAKVYRAEAFDKVEFLARWIPADSQPAPEDPTQANAQTIGVTLAVEGLSEIGKTLAMIWSENPGFEYRTVQIPGAAGLCLKEIQDGPLCFFVGTHAGPSLQELGGEYADQLRCAGIVSTVGRMFPETVDGVSLERFFNGLGVAEYAHHTQDGSGQGWIEFSYGGYRVWIDTNGEGPHYIESSVMRHDYPLIIVDKEIEIANSAISDEYTGAAAVVDAYQYQKRLATLDGLDHMPLDELPQEVLDSLTLVSETDLSGNYTADWGWYRTYTAPGLEIVTSAPSAAYLEWLEKVEKDNRDLYPTEEDFYAHIEGEEDREWVIRVTITDDKFTTLDGLKVGMTCEQAETLGYSLRNGRNAIGNTEIDLDVIVENNTVVKMTTWWLMGRYIGKFFEL